MASIKNLQKTQSNGETKMNLEKEVAFGKLCEAYDKARLKLDKHYETCSNEMLDKLIAEKEKAASNLNSNEALAKMVKKMRQ